MVMVMVMVGGLRDAQESARLFPEALRELQCLFGHEKHMLKYLHLRKSLAFVMNLFKQLLIKHIM